LRFLEDGEIRAAGSDQSQVRVDVRVVAATHRNLDDLVTAGLFREDLLYRLRVIHLHVPPLRERAEDVQALMRHFIAAAERDLTFTDDALRALRNHTWPGNVRELRNVVERAVYRHEDPERAIDEMVFDPFHSPWAPSAQRAAFTQGEPEQGGDPASPPLQLAEPVRSAPSAEPVNDFRSAVDSYERTLLQDALSRNRFNQRATASALGLSYDQLRHALKRHKLQDSAA